MKTQLLASDLDYIFEHTLDVWEEFRHARLFITGGTGFFGKWLLESFIWANHYLNLDAQVMVLTRQPESFRKNYPYLANAKIVQLYAGDVRQFVLPPGKFSHVIHAGTEASVKLNLENPLAMLETIIQGTSRTLQFAKTCGAEKFLFISSGAIYGQQPSHLTHILESFTGSPSIEDQGGAYANGKRLAEHLCIQFANEFKMQIKIARCFAFVGPYLSLQSHFAIGNFIRDGLKGGPIEVNGDGTPYRSYLYAADLVIWLLKILCRGKNASPYNVGSEEAYSIAEVALQVANYFSPKLTVDIKKIASPNAVPTRYVPSVQRALTDLKLPQYISLEKSVARTIQWHERN